MSSTAVLSSPLPLVTNSAVGGALQVMGSAVAANASFRISAGRGGRGGRGRGGRCSSRGSTPFSNTNGFRGTMVGGQLPDGLGGTRGAGVRGGSMGGAWTDPWIGLGGTGGGGITLAFIVPGRGLEGAETLAGRGVVGGQLLCDRVLRLSVAAILLVPLGSNFWMRFDTLEPKCTGTTPSNRSSTSTSTKPETRRIVVLMLARWLSVKHRSDKSWRGGLGGGWALRLDGGELNGFGVT